MSIENFKYKEVLNKTIKEGNKNPWATSSSTHHKIVIWLKPLEDDLFFEDELNAIKEYVWRQYIKSHPQAPICRGVLREYRTWDDMFRGVDGYASEWTIEYYETIYHN